MPTFEQYILSAPYGFTNACLAVNKLLSENEEGSPLATIIEDIVQESWNNVVNKIDSDQFNQYKNEKKAIIYIIKSMKQSNPAPSIANAANLLASNSFLTKDAIEKILIKIKELSSQENTDTKQILKSSTKMQNFQWKIGVAISSNTCKSLFAPYVSIRFDLKNEEGKLVPHTAELSYEQFKVRFILQLCYFMSYFFFLLLFV
jgi:hypothetical protein